MKLKKWLIAGGIIAGLGLILLIVGIIVNDGWGKNHQYETQTFTAQTEIQSLSLQMDYGTLKTQIYDGEKITVEYPTTAGLTGRATERNGTLLFHQTAKWYFKGEKIKNIPPVLVQIPQSLCVNLEIELNAGTCELTGGNFQSVQLELDVGTARISNITAQSLNLELSAGELTVENCAVSHAELQVNAGKMTTTELNCPNLSVEVSAGEANVNLTGNKADYSIFVEVNLGNCNVSPQRGTTEKRLEIEVSAGNANVSFAE